MNTSSKSQSQSVETGVKSYAEVVEVTEESPDRTPGCPKIDLRDAHAIRRELGAVYRDMRARRIETQEGTRLAYVLDMLRKAFETGVLQERLEAIEQVVKPNRIKG